MDMLPLHIKRSQLRAIFWACPSGWRLWKDPEHAGGVYVFQLAWEGPPGRTGGIVYAEGGLCHSRFHWLKQATACKGRQSTARLHAEQHTPECEGPRVPVQNVHLHKGNMQTREIQHVWIAFTYWLHIYGEGFIFR